MFYNFLNTVLPNPSITFRPGDSWTTFGIFELLDESFSSFIELVSSFFTEISKVVVLMGETIVRIPHYIAFAVPSELSYFFIALISVTVVYRVVGND